eukprot:4138600-Ditylum_brightwellii.AAC.1
MEVELQIEYGILMEVKPITMPMAVLSQNWPSWVNSLDIMGCKDIQVVLNSWEECKQEWLQTTMQEVRHNIKI